MSKKTVKNNSYENFLSAIKSGKIGNFYIFHGEERYLLDYCVGQIRAALCPDGLDSFNYKQYDGNGLSLDQLEDAVNTYPAFAEKTLIEVHDFDIFKADIRERILEIVSDLPEYTCLLFIYGTTPYKPDGRLKANKEIQKHADIVEFTVQDQEKLVRWIKRHFSDNGKKIDTRNAEYIAFITGGLMSNLKGEIEKVAAYSKLETISRSDIDAVVIPVLDAVTYRLTDCILSSDHKRSTKILSELFQMREPPHKMIYSISLKMRQLLVARVCIENNLDVRTLMSISGLRHDFQARAIWNTAKKTSLAQCRNSVLFCSATALELNSTLDPEARIIELVCKIALSKHLLK